MWTSFIGFMASGKSTLTRRLQVTTNHPAVFLDDIIAEEAGCSVAEIFASGGEESFRARELDALSGLDPDRSLVLDTGGGIVQTPAAVDLLRDRGVVIWLDASWDVIRSRLKVDSPGQRPLVDMLGWAGIEELFRRRRPLYAAAADFRLRTTDMDVEQLARVSMLRSLIWGRRKDGEGR
ncbi:MAG: shikimate kinase [Candidatus Krumholzibacteriota bacterium]